MKHPMELEEYRDNRVIQKVVRGSAVDWMQQESSKMGWSPKIRTDPRLYTQDWSSSVYSYGKKGKGKNYGTVLLFFSFICCLNRILASTLCCKIEFLTK